MNGCSRQHPPQRITTQPARTPNACRRSSTQGTLWWRKWPPTGRSCWRRSTDAIQRRGALPLL